MNYKNIEDSEELLQAAEKIHKYKFSSSAYYDSDRPIFLHTDTSLTKKSKIIKSNKFTYQHMETGFFAFMIDKDFFKYFRISYGGDILFSEIVPSNNIEDDNSSKETRIISPKFSMTGSQISNYLKKTLSSKGNKLFFILFAANENSTLDFTLRQDIQESNLKLEFQIYRSFSKDVISLLAKKALDKTSSSIIRLLKKQRKRNYFRKIALNLFVQQENTLPVIYKINDYDFCEYMPETDHDDYRPFRELDWAMHEKEFTEAKNNLAKTKYPDGTPRNDFDYNEAIKELKKAESKLDKKRHAIYSETNLEKLAFLHENYFSYYKDGKKLELIKDYFIFDIDLFCKLFFHKDDAEYGKDVFVKILRRYKYSFSEHEVVLSKLIKFYKFILEKNQSEIEEANQNLIRIYIRKLEGATHEAVYNEIYSNKGSSKESKISKELPKIEKYFKEMEWCYVKFNRILERNPKKNEYITSKELEEINAKVEKMISEYNTPTNDNS